MKRALVLCASIVAGTIVVYASPRVEGPSGFFYLAILATLQTCIVLIPALIVYQLSRLTKSKIMAIVFHSVALTSLVVLIANYKLHSMYNYFIDGFVINLMMTPGGIDALGLSPSFYRSCAVLIGVSALLYAGLVRWVPLELPLGRLPSKGRLAALALLVLAGETAVFSHAAYTSNAQILSIADRVVWHIPVSARSFYRRLGVEEAGRQLADASPRHAGDLAYPPTDLLSATAEKPFNIIWLTAESLRADMLNATIMPRTWAFSEKNSRFTDHYSGGNGTRLGMFSQFYGLYGSYWFDVLDRRRSPLLIDTLLANGYDVTAFTSARFTYPEFDKTIFSRVPAANLHEYYRGKGWERDRENTTSLIAHISKAATTGRPFFAFMFFESSHANYYFPSDYTIAEPFLDDFDYLSVDIAANIDLIKNRYINASHYLDSRLGLVFDALEANDLLDDTIVIVTGDHGEEFMEKGRWGHNSTFVQEQIRVPLVIHIPGRAARVFHRMTSHLDLPATVLSALGYRQNPDWYSFGQDLFASTYERNYTVAGDWHGDVLITPRAKLVLSLKGARNGAALTTLDDAPLPAADLPPADRQLLADFIQELPRFYRDSPAFRSHAQLPRQRADTRRGRPTEAALAAQSHRR